MLDITANDDIYTTNWSVFVNKPEVHKMSLLNLFTTWRTNRMSKKTTEKIVGQREKDRKQQLALAALSERLAAHQKAFALWYRMQNLIHDKDHDKIWNAVVEAQEWWVDHCLYLVREARDAFIDSIHAAEQHRALVNAWQQQAQMGYDATEAIESMNENWRTYTKFGSIVQDCVDFPGFGQKELFPDTDPITGKKLSDTQL